jgi:hypothetical protein
VDEQVDPHAAIRSHYWEIKYNEARPFVLGAIPAAFLAGLIVSHFWMPTIETKEVPVEKIVTKDVIKEVPVDRVVVKDPQEINQANQKLIDDIKERCRSTRLSNLYPSARPLWTVVCFNTFDHEVEP